MENASCLGVTILSKNQGAGVAVRRWQVFLGPLLILIALFTKGGVLSLFKSNIGGSHA